MKGTINIILVSMLVLIGLYALLYFGINMLGSMAQSTAVISENIDYINNIDAAHMMLACMETDGVIRKDDVKTFSVRKCYSDFPGLSNLDLEIRITDVISGSVLSDTGYDKLSAAPSHTITFNYVDDDGETSIGRINVQTDE